jgi:hypothetical protein
MARKSSKKSSTLADLYDRVSASLRASGGTASLIAVALCVVTAIVLLATGVPRLRSYLDERSFVPAGEITMSFVDPPSWWDAIRADEIRRMVANAVGDGSAIDPARLATAQEALQQCGWFRSIRQVSLDAGGGFVVDATFRQPVAAVLHAGREYLIDGEACRVPVEWELGQRPARPHWISLHHAAEPPPGAPGGRWSGRDVDAGLALLAAMRDRRWESQVAAIDLGSFEGDGLVLRTVNNGLIMWGYPPGTSTSAEPPSDAKLRNLDHLFATTGRIDNGAGRIVDLRTDVPSIRVAAEGGAAPSADAAGIVR